MKQRRKHSYDTKSIHDRILPILKTFDQVCREHNLTYYLWAGTQLGAVRHGGFIPWDDDADVAMPRKDYNILMEHAEEWMPAPFQIADLRTSERYPHYFARVQDTTTTMIIRKHLGYVEGIHIDIFPLDSVPDNKSARSRHFAKLKFYQRLLYMAARSPKKDNKRYKALYYNIIQKFLSPKGILEAIDRHIQRPNKKAAENFADSFYGSNAFFPYSMLGTPTPYNFCGEEFYGVEQVEKYLSEKYGDYMTLPSESGRVQHSVDFLDFDLPFAQFDIRSLEE